ncbi:hypothetical protein KIPB_010611, partial [Kipferlia bialata]|eukprot:g10611.t1
MGASLSSSNAVQDGCTSFTVCTDTPVLVSGQLHFH